jgi:hypothetical protein
MNVVPMVLMLPETDVSLVQLLIEMTVVNVVLLENSWIEERRNTVQLVKILSMVDAV